MLNLAYFHIISENKKEVNKHFDLFSIHLIILLIYFALSKNYSINGIWFQLNRICCNIYTVRITIKTDETD